MTVNQGNIKSFLRKQPYLFSLLRNVRLKWQNYFSELGEIPRRFNQFKAGLDREFQSQHRKKIAKFFYKCSKDATLKLVLDLKRNGYALVRFEDLQIDAEEAMLFLEKLIEDFKSDSSEHKNLESGEYDGKPLSYHLYKKSDQVIDIDPLMSLICHPKMIEIASLYLGYLPMIGFTCLMYTPLHDDNEQFGAQLWHRDLHHRHSLKLFFSPLTLDEDQGPFEFFPPHLSTLKYYKYFPQSMTDEQLAEQGLDPRTSHKFLGGRGNLLIIDTARCLHRGGRTKKKARFIATSVYNPPHHSFSAKKFRQTEHYTCPFGLYLRENRTLLESFTLRE